MGCRAYQVLSDEGKRKMYDQTGSTEENPFSGFENEDIFNAFRGFGGGGGGRRGQGRGGNMGGGGFESIFEDLFGGMGGQQRGQRQSVE